MKLMIATPYYFPQTGGLENYAQHIAEGLRDGGWEVVVVCGDKRVKSVTRETLDGYVVYRLPIWKVVSNTPVHPGWLWMLRRIVRAERPDVINAHTPVPFMVDMVMWAAGRRPVVVTYHAATLFKPGSFVMRAMTAGYGLVQAATLARARAIIAVSGYVKTALGEKLGAKTHVVFNAVAGVAPARRTAGEGLVFVANLEPAHAWKGLDLVLDSLSVARGRYGKAPQLTIVGDGADRARYEARVRELDLEGTVRFTGRLVGAARDAAVRAAAALVLYPTTANDAFPTVLVEAWAQGVPVVAAGIGPIPSLVEDGKTGRVVRANDPAALAEATHEVLGDLEAARAMGEAGRKLVAAEYTWARQVERIKALLEKLA
jgi:glycosyltransferase involved in cell wall biosynthesis